MGRDRKRTERFVAEPAPPPRKLAAAAKLAKGKLPSELSRRALQHPPPLVLDAVGVEQEEAVAPAAPPVEISCRCRHRPPTRDALDVLNEPALWVCKACGSTDGVWVCLACGHVGCGRHATHPLLGGGHARHHYCASGHPLCFDAVSRRLLCHKCDAPLANAPRWLDELRKLVSDAEARPPRPDAARQPSDERAGASDATANGGALVAPPGLAGLANLGNTCYLNAALQVRRAAATRGCVCLRRAARAQTGARGCCAYVCGLHCSRGFARAHLAKVACCVRTVWWLSILGASCLAAALGPHPSLHTSLY
eukprot:5753294-Prymnesium_polylepis.1